MIEKFLRVSALFDFYGALLTEKQMRCLEMHFSNDLSLSEIADQFGVSRQAIYDIIHRSEQTLNAYEDKLGLLARHEEEQKKIREIDEAVRQLPPEIRDLPEIGIVLAKLADLTGKAKEAKHDF